MRPNPRTNRQHYRQPKLLDLCCGSGGAALGYHWAGFDVTGVDIKSQVNYPFKFIKADAMNFPLEEMQKYDAIHASPPCGAYTVARHMNPQERRKHYPELVKPLRGLFQETGLPYVIENVMGAPLIASVMLCGTMFPNLKVYRHRLFEANFPIPQPPHPKHKNKVAPKERPPEPDEFMTIAGHFMGVDEARQAMGGLYWMSTRDLAEAIPPQYTFFIAKHMLRAFSEKQPEMVQI